MSRLVLPRATHNSTSVSRAVRRAAEVAILLAQALQACGVSVAIIAFNS
jgi:cobalamin biosynthesis protein CobT